VESQAAFQIDPAALLPLLEMAAEVAVQRFARDQDLLRGKLAFTEPEAAALLSLAPHQLRDARLRGEITASVGPGRRILYQRQNLLDYLTSRRWLKS
jgi:hypothetical protein